MKKKEKILLLEDKIKSLEDQIKSMHSDIHKIIDGDENVKNNYIKSREISKIFESVVWAGSSMCLGHSVTKDNQNDFPF